MKIIFEKMIIKNWGPFLKETEIEFSQHEDKPITYVFGLNSTGKTHIFEAIYWCLFNDMRVDELKEIVNKESLTDKDAEMTVQMKFYTIDDYENKQEYEIKRSVKYRVRGSENGELLPEIIQPDFIGKKTSSLTNKQVLFNQSEFRKLMDNYIPPGPRRFFFLDGEKLATLFQKENLQQIEQYANALSDVHLIDNMISNLGKLYNLLENKQPKNMSGSIESQKRKKMQEEGVLEGAEARHAEIVLNLKSASELEMTLAETCEKYEKFKQKIDNIKALEAERDKHTAIKRTQFSQIKEYQNEHMPKLLVKEQIASCLSELTRLEEEGTIPPPIPPDLLERLLSSSESRCICGREITEEIRREFIKIQNYIPDKNLNDKIQRLRIILDSMKVQIDEISIKLVNKLEHIKRTNIEINRITNEISKERGLIPPDMVSDYENINAKFIRWNRVKDEIRELQTSLEYILNQITAQKLVVKREKERLESLYKKDEKYRKTGELIEFVRNSEECAELIKTEVQRSIINFVCSNTSEQFKGLIWDPQNWEKVDIDENWRITAITTGNYRIQCDRLSQGQRHVLGISFMSSLGKVTGNFIPFVFDSPFGRVSEEPIENIGQNLPKLMEGRQVILFVTDTESKNILPHIEEIIGSRYVIDKLSGTESVVRSVL